MIRAFGPFPVFAIAFMAACGGPTAARPGEDKPGTAHIAPSDPSDPSLPAPGGACRVDEDCVLRAPGGCCSVACPSERYAVARSVAMAQDEDCAVVECAVVEEVACPPDAPPAPTQARCEAGHCVAH